VNAKDAASTGLGVEGKSFDITTLLDFEKDYIPDNSFREWLSKAEELFLKNLVLAGR
jgi:hypothetical protein